MRRRAVIPYGIAAVAGLALCSFPAAAQDQAAISAGATSERILAPSDEPNRPFKEGKVVHALRVTGTPPSIDATTRMTRRSGSRTPTRTVTASSTTSSVRSIATRDLSVQAYLQPFVAVGDYSNIRRLAAPKSFEFDPVTIASNPDFNTKSLRGNVVMRGNTSQEARASYWLNR